MMELSSLPEPEKVPSAENDQGDDKEEKEDEVDLLIPSDEAEYCSDSLDNGEFDLSVDIKPPKHTCCGEIPFSVLKRRLGYLCIGLFALVVLIATLRAPLKPAEEILALSPSKTQVPIASVSAPSTSTKPLLPPASVSSKSTSTVPKDTSFPSTPSQSTVSAPKAPKITPPVTKKIETAPAVTAVPIAPMPPMPEPPMPEAPMPEVPTEAPAAPEEPMPSDTPEEPAVTPEVTQPAPVEIVPPQGAPAEDATGTLRREMRALAARLTPRDWNITKSPKQFMHMHHMKTGGTSVDGLLDCAISRWNQLTRVDLPYYRVSECSGGVARCEKSLERGDTSSCPVNTSVVMSYCAALDAVDRFGWGDADKFTILRDPIDRVWSMYRFSLQGCYHCKTLPQVYKELDDGATYPGVCGSQLLNHQTENMLSASMRARAASLTEEQLIAEAIENMQTRFTVVGLTGEFKDSIKMITKVFPFLAENLTEVSGGALRDNVICKIEHANEGRPPTCGTRVLDDSIRRLIIEHNQRDVQLYQAALVHFQKEKKILIEGETYEDVQEDMQEDMQEDVQDELGGAE